MFSKGGSFTIDNPPSKRTKVGKTWGKVKGEFNYDLSGEFSPKIKKAYKNLLENKGFRLVSIGSPISKNDPLIKLIP
jgi:hypothetical protein